MKFWLAVACFSLALTLLAERQPFERYQTIVDRQMFGQPPPGFDPTKPPSEVSREAGRGDGVELTREQEQLKSAIHFSVINVSSTGETLVGFSDKSDPKAVKHYYLKLGETRDGWTVKEADAPSQTMTIVKNDVEVSLHLGDDSATGAGTTGKAGGSAARPMMPGLSGRRAGVLNSTAGGGTLRDRRLGRRAERAAQAAAMAQQAEEQRQREAEREAQLAEERAQSAEERAQQREQLLAIQEELRRQREAKLSAEESGHDSESESEE